jgi:hypothetical protein
VGAAVGVLGTGVLVRLGLTVLVGVALATTFEPAIVTVVETNGEVLLTRLMACTSMV